jgi:hypothetical protein
MEKWLVSVSFRNFWLKGKSSLAKNISVRQSLYFNLCRCCLTFGDKIKTDFGRRAESRNKQLPGSGSHIFFYD